MIALSLARELKRSGLAWTPTACDFFGIPDRGLDDKVFVISDMLVNLALIGNEAAVTFQGSVEWALDYLVVSELVWLPTEAQLREQIEQYLPGEPQPVVRLSRTTVGYTCEIRYRGEHLAFEAFGASEAYAEALRYVLDARRGQLP
jgi:hypothetical protein